MTALEYGGCISIFRYNIDRISNCTFNKTSSEVLGSSIAIFYSKINEISNNSFT